MDSTYSLRKADFAQDKQQILAVWERNGVNPYNPEGHYAWAYENNPCGQGIMFLLEHGPSRQIVGTHGLIARRLKVGDSVRVVGRAAGLAVDQSHRALGPALMLQKAVLGDLAGSGMSLVYTVAPPKAKPVFKRLNYRSLGTVDCRRKVFSVSEAVDNRFPSLPRLVRTQLSHILGLAVQASSPETRHPLRRAPMVRVATFDSRFDDLWARAQRHYSFTTERTSAFLRWRFTENAQPRDYICDALRGDDGALRGYAVYYVDQSHFARVVDLFAEDRGEATVALLTGLARRWRSDGVKSAVLSAFGPGRFFESLESIGMSKARAPEQWPYELMLSSSECNVDKLNPAELDWGFTMADDFLDHV